MNAQIEPPTSAPSGQIQPPPQPSHRAAIVETIQTLALAAIFYIAVSFATARVVVDGPSMRPTLVSGEWVIVNRLAYRFGAPARGDIIVILPPTNAQIDDLIKRVIGLPGETLEIRDSRVYIDGRLLEEPYAQVATNPDSQWVLGPDQLFVMGDNRGLSLDSRSFGPIALDTVVGKALVIYWPPSEWGPLSWRSGGTTISTPTGTPVVAK